MKPRYKFQYSRRCIFIAMIGRGDFWIDPKTEQVFRVYSNYGFGLSSRNSFHMLDGSILASYQKAYAMYKMQSDDDPSVSPNARTV